MTRPAYCRVVYAACILFMACAWAGLAIVMGLVGG